MSAALRFVAIMGAVLMVGGAIFIATMSGQGGGADRPVDKTGVGIGATDPQRHPWVLEVCTRPPYYQWQFVARYPSEEICEEWRDRLQAQTKRLHRCRLDSRAGGGC